MDYKRIKDLVHGVLDGDDQPAIDPSIGMCDLPTWQKAFTAFSRLIRNTFPQAMINVCLLEAPNGHEFNGTLLDAIIEYPDRVT